MTIRTNEDNYIILILSKCICGVGTRGIARTQRIKSLGVTRLGVCCACRCHQIAQYRGDI